MAETLDLSLAEEFAKAIHLRVGDNVRRVSLFGSRARRDQNRHSDFDLMVVLDAPTGAARSAIHTLAQEWELEHRVELSTKILSLTDFSTGLRSLQTFWKNFKRDEQVLWPMTETNE